MQEAVTPRKEESVLHPNVWTPAKNRKRKLDIEDELNYKRSKFDKRPLCYHPTDISMYRRRFQRRRRGRRVFRKRPYKKRTFRRSTFRKKRVPKFKRSLRRATKLCKRARYQTARFQRLNINRKEIANGTFNCGYDGETFHDNQFWVTYIDIEHGWLPNSSYYEQIWDKWHRHTVNQVSMQLNKVEIQETQAFMTHRRDPSFPEKGHPSSQYQFISKKILKPKAWYRFYADQREQNAEFDDLADTPYTNPTKWRPLNFYGDNRCSLTHRMKRMYGRPLAVIERNWDQFYDFYHSNGHSLARDFFGHPINPSDEGITPYFHFTAGTHPPTRVKIAFDNPFRKDDFIDDPNKIGRHSVKWTVNLHSSYVTSTSHWHPKLRESTAVGVQTVKKNADGSVTKQCLDIMHPQKNGDNPMQTVTFPPSD
jgi:hypothetical protein